MTPVGQRLADELVGLSPEERPRWAHAYASIRGIGPFGEVALQKAGHALEMVGATPAALAAVREEQEAGK